MPKIIAPRQLGHLENNQATVVCARRDGKNFPPARYKPRRRQGRPRHPSSQIRPEAPEDSAEIAPRVLSRELKALVAAGLIARKDYGLVPPKVEYRLTEAGESFTPIIASIRQWGERHLGGPTADGG